MKILLLGSGGREAALAWKISESPLTEKLWIAPGNGGTDRYGENVALSPLDFASIAEFVGNHGVDMVVVGNEDPLVEGLRDYLSPRYENLLIVGPGADGARLEGSKEFAKEFMERHGIPTAAYRSFTTETIEEGKRFLESLRAPYVLKADGLAAGKGVVILDNLDDAKRSLEEMLGGQFGKASSTVVIEEFLKGIECSVFVLTDGHGKYRLLPVAKDYKRIGEGDQGLNTGGMGAVSPVPFADDRFMTKVVERIVEPTVNGLIAEGIDYRGFIFLGLINVEGEPMVIEYNVRMGDPETEAVMPRISSDLTALLASAARGDLGDLELEIDPRAAATVMAVSAGYPGSYEKGKEITLGEFGGDVVVFHAGTKRDNDGRLVTSGGRVITATGRGTTLTDALKEAYKAQESIAFEGKTLRRDIGYEFIG